MEDNEHNWYCKSYPEYGVEGLYYIHAETGKLVQVTNVSPEKGKNDEYMWDDTEYVGPIILCTCRIIPHHEAEEHNKYII